MFLFVLYSKIKGSSSFVGYAKKWKLLKQTWRVLPNLNFGSRWLILWSSVFTNACISHETGFRFTQNKIYFLQKFDTSCDKKKIEYKKVLKTIYRSIWFNILFFDYSTFAHPTKVHSFIFITTNIHSSS